MHFLTPLFTKSFVGWRFAYSAPPDSLAVFRGPTKGREWSGEDRRVGKQFVLCPSIIRILQTYFRKVDVFFGGGAV